ncbi:DUF2207 domain-containing protein [Nocardioides sp.]|uniref:DUF2207 domain-containing protein n=1 Tax=Nocardioides sp. TaxID=35761 RepID=UPI0039E3892A
MTRILVYLAGIAAIGAVFCLPALFFDISGVDGDGYEPTSISRYDASFVMNDDGDITVTEDIDVDVSTSDRHGIYRFFDRLDDNAPHARRTPEGISVTRDGQPEPYETGRQDLGRYLYLKIGDADRYLSQGTHNYKISYTIDGTLLPSREGGSSFYWNVVPGGWQQDISDVDITVALPVAAGQTVRCTVGWGGGTPCTAEGAGTQQLSLHVDHVDARTPVTILTDLAMATPPEGNHLPWTIRWDAVLGTNVAGLVVVVLLGVGGAVAGGLLGAKAREREPGFPLTYAPPDGLTPAQGNYILTEQLPKRAYVATLLQAAQQGSVELSRSGREWTLTRKSDSYDPADLAQVTAARLAGSAGSFTASKKNLAAGKALQSEMSTFNSDVKKWALSTGLLSRTGLGGIGAVMVFGGLILAGVCLFVRPFGMSMTGIVPGAFAIFGSSMAAAGAGTKRTATGRQLWSQLGGFKRVLSTPSSKQRFDFSGREELYTAYIPWAVAFDCADAWAAKYRTEMGAEPPAPSYFGAAYVGSHSGDFASSMVHDFESTLSGAVSAYSASQSHSSGGGDGGFSGGGGGGGGGGGSW